MNIEIKEILDFKEDADYKRLSYGEIKILLDYITNLQQENERLKESNKILEENWEHYMMKCEKAIEYINENKHLSMFADCRETEEDWNYDLECSANDLLNILQNGSEEKLNQLKEYDNWIFHPEIISK